MIDSLELRVPLTAPRGPVWAARDIKTAKRMNSGTYELAQDLRPHVPLKVFWDHRFAHDRKLQFITVNKLDAHAIVTSITELFELEPLDLELVRVDFAVDVEIPLQWFAENLTVQRKRRRDGWGDETRRSRWEGTSLYFGRRPSTIRVYDKKAEMLSRGQKISSEVLTRVEHQAHRAALHRLGLRTLGDLLQRAPELNPFDSVRLPDQATLLASTSRPPLKTHLARVGLTKELETMTRAQLELHYKNQGYRNAARDLDKLLPFAATRIVDVPDLGALFSASVKRQLFSTAEEIAA